MTDPPSRLPIRLASGPTLACVPSPDPSIPRLHRSAVSAVDGASAALLRSSLGLSDLGPSQSRRGRRRRPRVTRSALSRRPPSRGSNVRTLLFQLTNDSDRTTSIAPPSTNVILTADPSTTVVSVSAPPINEEPSVVARPVPAEPPPPPDAPPAPWADSVFETSGGHLSTDVGCARDLSAVGLDEFYCGAGSDR